MCINYIYRVLCSKSARLIAVKDCNIFHVQEPFNLTKVTMNNHKLFLSVNYSGVLLSEYLNLILKSSETLKPG